MKKSLLISVFLFLGICVMHAQTDSWIGYGNLPTNATFCSVVDNNNNTWVATFGDGVAKLTEGILTNYNVSNTSGALPDNYINYITIDKLGHKWIGTNNQGAVKYDGTTWTVFNNSNGLPGNQINCIAVETNNNKWIGIQGQGVTFYNGTNFITYKSPTIPNNNVTSVAIDGNNNKWVGTYGGLAKYNGTSWTLYTTGNSGLANDQVLSVAVENNNAIWVGTGGGLCRFDGVSSWQTYHTGNSSLPYNYVSSIAIDHSGNKWVGTTQGGMAKFTGSTWTIFNTGNSGIPGLEIRNIYIDANDNKWVSCGAPGLGYYGIDPVSIATLSNINLSEGTLNPVFSPNTLNYNVSVPISTVNVPTVTPVPSYSGAIITQTNATGFTAGINVTTINVLSADEEYSKVYTITFTKAAPSNIATLSNISLSAGTLNPTFASSTYNYNVVMPYSTVAVPSVTPTLTDPNASITSQTNATDFVSNNVTTILVTAENGTTTQTYTITFTKAAPSSVATLSNITLSAGTLSPSFASGTYNYNVVMPYSTVSVPTATPTLTTPTASITNLVQASDFETNNVATIEVTAQDGTTVLTYTITFTKVAPSTVATLSNITLSAGTLNPMFSSGTLNYAVEMPYSAASVPTVTPILTDPTASITNLVQASDFAGNNVTTIEVTAQDATTVLTYTITFTKAAASTVATLSNITLSAGTLSPSFASSTYNYSVAMPYGTTIVPTATPTLTTPTSSITNLVQASDFTTNNVTTIEVTAEDGITTKTYTITFTVLAAIVENNATLINLYFNSNNNLLFNEIPAKWNKNLQLSIVDILGATHYTAKDLNKTTKIDLSSFPSGIYIVKYKLDNAINAFKIFKL